jgi:hypothetical protein
VAPMLECLFCLLFRRFGDRYTKKSNGLENHDRVDKWRPFLAFAKAFEKTL